MENRVKRASASRTTTMLQVQYGAATADDHAGTIASDALCATMDGLRLCRSCFRGFACFILIYRMSTMEVLDSSTVELTRGPNGVL